MSSLNELPIEIIGASALVGLLALLIGHLWGRAGRRELLAEVEQARQRLARAETQVGETSRTLARMRGELDNVDLLASNMAEVIKPLNRDDVDPSIVPHLIFELAKGLFQPKRMLLYAAKTIGGPGGPQKKLHLLEHRGLDRVPPELQTIAMGQGKIGWVANHELEMLPEDWERISRNERTDVPDNHPALKADIMGPLIHHAKGGPEVLGVLCIGDPAIRPRNQKLTLQMVTNFGSMALNAARNMTKLREKAHHDGLTDLLNKAAMKDRAGKLLVECGKKAKPFSIFLFDIDNFKTYNDTNGHPAGDELLRDMAEMIRQYLRPGDLGCRYGGEEFMILMPETTKEAAFEQAEALRKAVSEHPFAHREKQPKKFVSISGGVASSPKDGMEVRELIQNADQALYLSKNGGRNRVTNYKGVEIGDSGQEPLISPDALPQEVTAQGAATP